MSRSVFNTIFGALVIVAVAFAPSVVFSEKLSRTEKFKTPDIKNDFCGVQMDFQYCKCAFHNEYCKDIGKERKVADFVVNSGFKAYVDGLRTMFADSCRQKGGKFTGDSCEYYEATKEESQCLPGDFNMSWKKYSDLDERIPVSDRSYEAKQYAETVAKMIDKTREIFLLRRDMEIDRQARLEVKQYKQALVQNIKTNLLKSFWRLAWITYDNIQSGRASNGTFEKMYDLPSHMESLASYLKTVRSITPNDSVIAINTDSIKGKAKSVGLSTVLDAVEAVGDPVTTATTLVSETVKQTFGSADITPEEVEILKNQHLRSKLLDNIIAESYARNIERRLQTEGLKAELENLKSQAADWESKEKDRTREELVKSCKDKK